jgi:predicted transcriptional regulator
MIMVGTSSPDVVLRVTAQIVAAHVENHSVAADALPALIEQVYRTLRDAAQTATEPEKPVSAVPVKQSVKPDFIVCLEDGKKLKTLRRHLMTSYNLTPAQYRARWDLPADLPHGGTELCEAAFVPRNKDRPRPKVCAGTGASEGTDAAYGPDTGAEARTASPPNTRLTVPCHDKPVGNRRFGRSVSGLDPDSRATPKCSSLQRSKARASLG